MISIFKNFSNYCFIILTVTGAMHSNNIYAQNLLDESSLSFASENNEDLFTETINVISRSGKIFILSNSNQLLNKGDFITLALKNKLASPVARAVVAKTHNQNAGIKILKVYSLERWKQLKKGLNIQILKGDDTALFKKKKAPKEKDEDETSIDSEEDLFNDKLLGGDQDPGDIYGDKRLIKPDNVLSIAWAPFFYQDPFNNDRRRANQFNYSWSYQFSDNYWAEGLYGRVSLRDFPATGVSTLINNFTARVKYTFKAPFYSYVLPYLGFQTKIISTSSDALLTTEQQAAVDDLNKADLIFGVTLLKRVVPGWFVKAELGSDILASLGVAVEF